MNHFSEIRQSFAEVKALRAEGDKWRYDEEPLSVFESTFGPVLNGQTIGELVSHLRAKKGHVRASNILGGRKVLEELGVDDGVSVRLINKSLVEGDTSKIRTIGENVLSKKTWEQIPAEQDLILSIGRAAYIGLPVSDDIWYWFLNQAWGKLAVGGVMLLQAPLGKGSGLESLSKIAQNVHGVTMRVHRYVDSNDHDTYYAIYVEKGAGSPKDFPPKSMK